MSVLVNLSLHLNLEVFQTEEVKHVELKAQESDFLVYSWKTSGDENWLERGLSVADVLGLVVLPRDLPKVIDMAEDST